MTQILARMRYRVSQGLTLLRPPIPLSLDQIEIVDRYLTASQRSAFMRMPLRDQLHHLCVAQKLDDTGWDDPELLQAALLHDIGKFDGGHGPNVADRTAVVIAGAVSPRLLARLTVTPRWWNSGLRRIEHHEQRGAEMAAQLGSTDRVQEIIANHGDTPGGEDAELRALQQADSAC